MADNPVHGSRAGVALAESDMWSILHEREQISRKLRISVADSCNLRCFFCHNEGQGSLGQVKISKFTIEDYRRVVEAAVRAGIREIKLTGGEPLLYRNSGQDVVGLVEAIDSLRASYQFDLSMITNGLLLPRYADRLKEAGLDRVTISLHTLDEVKHRSLISSGMGHRNDPADIILAIRMAVSAGLTPVKVNTVLFDGENGSNIAELPALIRECERLGVAQLRLYTLLKHEGFADHGAWYRFWDQRLLTELGNTLYESSQTAGDFAETASRLLSVRKSAIYPKPTLVVSSGKLEIAIEDLEAGRFESRGLPDEGPYSLRLSASGELRGILSQDSPSLDLGRILLQEDALAELEGAFRAARRELLP
jgi:molybdenum cofactor biosynthesis enzyme MoaA